MTTGWVAACIRAGAMARRRIGTAAVRQIAQAPSLTAALGLLSGSAYAPDPGGVTEVAQAQRAIADALLWQVRVLAGWSPASGRIPARALVAAFERENIVEHVRAMTGQRVPPPYQLGPLRTAWDRLALTRTPEELLHELSRTAWGTVGEQDPAPLRDALTAAWLRRVAAAVPDAAAWVRIAATLFVARIRFVEGRPLPAGAEPALVPVLGRDLLQVSDLRHLLAALDLGHHLLPPLEPEADQLWTAEAGLARTIDRDGHRLLRSGRYGPQPVLGAIAVLAVDAWRVRAALLAAAAGTGGGEVLDVVG